MDNVGETVHIVQPIQYSVLSNILPTLRKVFDLLGLWCLRGITELYFNPTKPEQFVDALPLMKFPSDTNLHPR